MAHPVINAIANFNAGTDIDTATPAIVSVVGPSSITEGTSGTITVTTSNVPDGTTLSWAVTHNELGLGPVSATGEYSATSGFVTIFGNSGTFSLSPTDDATSESDEYATVEVTGTVGGTAVSGTSNSIDIVDPAASPSISFSSVPSSINEGSSGTFQVTTVNIPQGTTLSWAINHTATVAGDFSADSGTFVTQSGNFGTFSISPIDDATTEGTESFTVTVTWTVPNGGSGESATSSSVDVIDASTPSITSVTKNPATPLTVDEGNNITFNVVTANIPDFTNLNWTVNHGSSEAGDFSAASGTVPVQSNAGSFTFQAVSDTDNTEGDETFTVTVSGTVSGTPVSATSSTITIIDKTPKIVSITGPSTVTEDGAGNYFNYAVTTENVPNGTTLNWSINHGTTTAADFASGTSGTVTISGNTGTIPIDISADTTTEGNETFTIQVSGTVNSTSLLENSSTITISDTSVSPVLAYTFGGASTVVEGNTLNFNATRTNGSGSTTIYYSIVTTAGGTFVRVVSADREGSITFAADGSVSGSADTLALSTVQGSVGGEIRWYSDSGRTTLLPNSPHSFTMIDAAPTYSIAAPASIDEGSSGSVSVSTTNIANGTTLYWTVEPSGDFGTTSGSVSISSNAASFNISPTADNTTEGAETGTVRLRTGSITGSIVASDTFTINDTSLDVKTVSISPSASNVNEGSTITFTVDATGYPDGNKVFSWAVNHGTTASADFPSTSGTVIVNSSGGSGSNTFTITPVADSTTEGAETFTVTVTDSTTPAINDTTTTITINDTSLTPSIDSVTGPASVNEGASATINVTTSNIANGTTLNWTINYDGGSTAAGDFDSTSGTATVTSNAASFTVPITADSTTEGAETFKVFVQEPVSTVSATSASITINDTSQVPASMDSSFTVSSHSLQQTFNSFPEAFGQYLIQWQPSSNRIRIISREGGSTQTAISSTSYVNYTGLTGITSVQAQYNVSSQSCTGSCYTGAFGPTPPNDGYATGTYYSIPQAGDLNFGYMAKVNTNTATSTSNVDASGGSITIRVVCDQGTFTATSNAYTIFLRATDGGTELE